MLQVFKFLLISLLIVISSAAKGESVVGHWVTFDDEDKIKKSTVELYLLDDKLYGKVVEIHDKSSGQDTCVKCKGDKKDQPILGLEILQGMVLSKNTWKDGEILDPENGKSYACKIWLEDNNTLKVRGYIGFFYRTQTWRRSDNQPSDLPD